MHGVIYMDDEEDPTNMWEIHDGVIPRVGEIVSYSASEINDVDEWDGEALKCEREMTGKSWRVKRVFHKFRRYRIDSLVHLIFVVLEEIEDE